MHVVFGIKNKDDAEVKWYAMSATYRSELKVKEYLDSSRWNVSFRWFPPSEL